MAAKYVSLQTDVPFGCLVLLLIIFSEVSLKTTFSYVHAICKVMKFLEITPAISPFITERYLTAECQQL
jgi:hypothetical protein